MVRGDANSCRGDGSDARDREGGYGADGDGRQWRHRRVGGNYGNDSRQWPSVLDLHVHQLDFCSQQPSEEEGLNPWESRQRMYNPCQSQSLAQTLPLTPDLVHGLAWNP